MQQRFIREPPHGLKGRQNAAIRYRLPRAAELKVRRISCVKAAREPIYVGITGGTVEYIMLHPVFTGWSFFICKSQKGYDKYD